MWSSYFNSLNSYVSMSLSLEIKRFPSEEGRKREKEAKNLWDPSFLIIADLPSLVITPEGMGE